MKKIYIIKKLKLLIAIGFLFLFHSNSYADDLVFNVTHANGTLNDGSIELSVSGGTAGYTFSWSSPDHPDFFSTNQNIYNLPPGLYCVFVVDDNGQGCAAEDCREVQDCSNTTTPCLITDFDYDYGYDGCDINFFDLSYGGEGNLTYEWSFGDGVISDEIDPNHTYSETGNYPVTLTVTDASGNSNTSQQFVYAACDVGVGTDCIIDGPTQVTVESAFTLSAITPGGVAPFTYNWLVYSSDVSPQYANPTGPGPHTFQFENTADNNEGHIFGVDITDANGNTYHCSHEVTTTGTVPDLDLAVFGVDDGNGNFLANNYMVFVAFADYWNVSFPFECKFDFIDPTGAFIHSSSWLDTDWDYDGVTFSTSGTHTAIVTRWHAPCSHKNATGWRYLSEVVPSINQAFGFNCQSSKVATSNGGGYFNIRIQKCTFPAGTPPVLTKTQQAGDTSPR